MSGSVPSAISFDYWNTLYLGASSVTRMKRRRDAVASLLVAAGHTVDGSALAAAYSAAGHEAERRWRDEHRGYGAEERVRDVLDRLGVERPGDCAHVASAVRAVDDALLEDPPELVPGAADGLRRLAERFTLGIVSDTGFSSGVAQDRVLERDGLLALFPVRIYSCDIGRAKPDSSLFAALTAGLGVAPAITVHVGDSERTDVIGALGAGLRAVRVDLLGTDAGTSVAEYVARDFTSLVDYLCATGDRADLPG